jgi:hypothetical protein
LSEEHIEEQAAPEVLEPGPEFDAELDPDDLGFGTPEVRPVRIGDTVIDVTVQRKLDNARVNEMIAKFNREAVGVITLNRRNNGKYYVVDGQHRRELLIRQGLEDDTVTANVYDGLTRQQEAFLFTLLNATKRPSPVDIFRARLVAGHRATRVMYDMLTKRNWTITLQPGDYRFAAVRTLENMYRVDPGITERTVDILTKAWNGQKDSMDYRILSGLFHMLERYGDQVTDKTLIKKLSEYRGSASGIIGAANTFRTTMQNRGRDAVAFVIVNEYNKSEREGNRLPQWDARRPS